MSKSSPFISPNNSHTRRRHNIHQQFHADFEPTDFSTTASLINFSSLNHGSRSQFPSSVSPQSLAVSKKFDDLLSEQATTFVSPDQPNQASFVNSSFSNFQNLIAAPAAQFWKNSVQAFAEQCTQTLNYEAPPVSFQSINCDEEEDEPELDLLMEMPYRDRTAEFRTVVKSTQLRVQPNGNPRNNDERERLIRSSIQFNQLARRIGRDLTMTCAKMERLTQMAKKKSLFQDHSSEMDELSKVLKKDITGLNKQIANLQQIAVERAGGQQPRGKEQHSKLVVVGLQSKLADVSNTFKNVLEICTENMKLKRNRREKFSQQTYGLSSFPPTHHAGNSLLLHDDVVASGSSSVALDMESLEQHLIRDQMSLIDGTQTYHQDRLGTMETIESSINELGTIFRQLASLVSEQGDMITRIDSNVEHSALNVEAAHHELLKYFNNISKNRWLILKVFGVLMAFFVFFVVFMT